MFDSISIMAGLSKLAFFISKIVYKRAGDLHSYSDLFKPEFVGSDGSKLEEESRNNLIEDDFNRFDVFDREEMEKGIDSINKLFNDNVIGSLKNLVGLVTVIEELSATERLGPEKDLLKDFFDAHGVDVASRSALIVTFRHLAGYKIEGKPKWGDKNNSSFIKSLTGPSFLRYVHKDIMVDDHVYKETIRNYDPLLMKAIEGYITRRNSRKQDLGDAEGIIFVVSKPPTNKVYDNASRPVKSPKAGSAPTRGRTPR